MSAFKKFFTKETNKSESPATAIAKLREIERMFAKKQEYLEMKINQEIEIARANGRTNRRVAVQALKRKKRYEQQLQQIDGTLSTIELQRESLESANTNTAVLSTMKEAAGALKTAHNKLNVEDVHEIIDDIAEQQTLAKEIAEAISAPWGHSDDVDDDDLLRELEELDQRELNQQLLDIPATPVLPLVPDAALPSSSGTASRPVPSTSAQSDNKDLDEELKMLQNWAL